MRGFHDHNHIRFKILPPLKVAYLTLLQPLILSLHLHLSPPLKLTLRSNRHNFQIAHGIDNYNKLHQIKSLCPLLKALIKTAPKSLNATPPQFTATSTNTTAKRTTTRHCQAHPITEPMSARGPSPPTLDSRTRIARAAQVAGGEDYFGAGHTDYLLGLFAEAFESGLVD